MKKFLLTFALLLSFSAHAEDPSTMDMYKRYEPHLVQPQYQQPITPYQQQYTVPQTDMGASGFPTWLNSFKQRASQQGLDYNFLNRALNDVEFLPRVIELDQKQPESKITFAEYRGNIVSDKRIRDGQEKFTEYRALLNRVSQIYGVQPQYIVALWGIETNYGKITGGFDILSSLATLAYEGRRAQFFEDELIKALRILQGGHAGTDKLTGSWAGAMGQSQFMPSSYLKYAVDGDGDGMVNIWNSMPDIFASMANYLRTEGWRGDLRWGRQVLVPQGIPAGEYGREVKKPLSYWVSRGVRQADGRALQIPPGSAEIMASLVAPDGPGNDTYLVYPNYNVIMHWNRSTYFATSVGLLADAIASAD